MSEITPAQKSALLKLEGFKAIRDQYAKEQKQKQAGAGKRRMKGRGFWDDVYNWFVDAGTTVNEFLKSTKIISNIAGAVLPILAPLGTALLTANPIAAAASVGAAKATAEGIKSLGYGSKMSGKGLTRQYNGLIINQKGKGAVQDAQAIARAIVGKPAMRGGDARLSIVPPEMRLQGKGLTRQYNGLIINQKGGRKMKGGGAGTEYGTVSSAFGEIVM
jgi:hypothetical protein